MQIPKKHPCLQVRDDMHTICKPLFTNTDIRKFYYIKLYDDGTSSGLFSDTEWQQYMLENKFYLIHANYLHTPHHLFSFKQENLPLYALPYFKEVFNVDNVIETHKEVKITGK